MPKQEHFPYKTCGIGWAVFGMPKDAPQTSKAEFSPLPSVTHPAFPWENSPQRHQGGMDMQELHPSGDAPGGFVKGWELIIPPEPFLWSLGGRGVRGLSPPRAAAPLSSTC